VRVAGTTIPVPVPLAISFRVASLAVSLTIAIGVVVALVQSILELVKRHLAHIVRRQCFIFVKLLQPWADGVPGVGRRHRGLEVLNPGPESVDCPALDVTIFVGAPHDLFPQSIKD
jgi:hypothetical protein